MGRPAPAMLALALALAGWLLLACAESAPEQPADPEIPPVRVEPGPHDVAVLELGELGEIHIELLPEIAPKSVAHFLERVRGGHYDGTTFHRVIPGFMIQGGSPSSRDPDPRRHGVRDEGPKLPDEFTAYPQVRGTVSFANSGTPHSGQMQFFILLEERDLDGRYAAFGRVVRGMDVADAVAALEIDVYGRYGPRNRPYPLDARIERIRIEAAGEAAGEAAARAGGGSADSRDPIRASG